MPALRKDGARVSVEFTIVPFIDDTGRMMGIAAILRDVTTRFEELRALRKELAAPDDVPRRGAHPKPDPHDIERRIVLL